MHNSCCRDIIRRLRISIATGRELSATGKLLLFLSSTGIFRYFLGRIAEMTEIEKSDRRNQLQKENHIKITCDSFLINMICYFAPRTSRNKDTDECYGKVKQVNQAEAFDIGVGEEVTVCLKHLRQETKLNNETCCYPLGDGTSCSTAFVPCPVRLMAIFKDLSSSCKGTYICRNHLEKADEIIGQATPPLFMISKGWNCFAVNCQKNLIQLYDRVTIFFLFVRVNVISPLPHCSSRLAPFCFMKNNSTHACIVSALSCECT